MRYCQVCNASEERRKIYFNKKLGMNLCEKHYQQFYPELRNRNNDNNLLKIISQLSGEQRRNIEQYFYSKIQQ